MSKKSDPDERRRRQRADGLRNDSEILTAAIRLFTEQPDASMSRVAEAAGVSRQTVYAHYPNRDALLRAVLTKLTADVLAVLDTTDADGDDAWTALNRFFATSWDSFTTNPVLLSTAAAALGDNESALLHAPVFARMRALIVRARDEGRIDGTLDPDWLLAASAALGHQAGNEVVAGRMDAATAKQAFLISVDRLFKPR